jgi:N-acetylglucosamine-6-phosphate deacetylase
MATLNPARALGVWHIGQIDVGADADIALIDDAGNVRLTMVAGQIINESKRINE